MGPDQRHQAIAELIRKIEKKKAKLAITARWVGGAGGDGISSNMIWSLSFLKSSLPKGSTSRRPALLDCAPQDKPVNLDVSLDVSYLRWPRETIRFQCSFSVTSYNTCRGKIP
jgi:hypothetical protein